MITMIPWHSRRANDKEISSIDKIDLLEPSFAMSSDTNIECTLSVK